MSKKQSQPKIQPATPLQIKTVNINLIRFVLALFVLVLYAKSTQFEFTLDDDLFYLKHKSVQKGISGFNEFFQYGSLNQFDDTKGVQPYRPVTLLVFGIQKELFDNSAPAAHWVNVLLYLLLIQIMFSFLRKLFPDIHPWMAAMISLLFMVHPIHTEVVNSVKSMDELLAALFGFTSWLFFLKATDKNDFDAIGVIAAGFFFALALFSKESAIVFMVLIPLSLLMLRQKTIGKVLTISLPLIFITILFLFVRTQVMTSQSDNTDLAVLDNVLNAAKTFGEKTATRAVILFYYFKLLFIPWPLNWDYSYNQIPLTNWSSVMAWLGLLIYGALFIFSVLNFKKQPLISFCILFFFIASSPTNNLFILNGATVGERFLFVPSFAFALAITYLLGKYAQVSWSDFTGKHKRLFLISIFSLLIVFTGLTMSRSSDWKNNLSLFEKGVERSPNSSRAQYSLATTYMTEAGKTEDPAEKTNFFKKSIEHFTKSMEILPQNKLAHYNSGICYSLLGDTSSAIEHYRIAISQDSSYLMPINNLGVIYQAKRNYDSAEHYYQLALTVSPSATTPRKNLGDLYFMQGIDFSRLGDTEKMLQAYRKSMVYSTGNPMLMNNMGSWFSSNKNYDSALVYLKKGLDIDPSNLMVMENVAAVSFLNKDYPQAIAYANKVLSVNKNSKKSYGVLADTYSAMGKTQEAEQYRKAFDEMR
jgi:tetratricopeptide (TPR) repeat protein